MKFIGRVPIRAISAWKCIQSNRPIYMMLVLIGFSLLAGCTSDRQTSSPQLPVDETQASETRPTSPIQTAVKSESIEGIESTATAPMLPRTQEAPISKSPVPAGEANAVEDLARRLKVDGSAIEFLSSVPDEFPAGDLGCPDPKATSQPVDAIVTGQRLLLAYDGVEYEYHIHASQIAYCGIR